MTSSERAAVARATWDADVNGRRARWTIMRGHRPCIFCRADVAAGQPYRRTTKNDLVCCAGCAKARYDEDVPSDLPVLPVVAQVRHENEFASFDRRSVAGAVRRNILDARQRQTGERE